MENTTVQKRLSFEKIRQLRKAGVAKPKEVTWSEWNAPFELTAVQESMCYRHATGMSIKKVSEEMELSYSHVSKTLKSEICEFRVKELQFQIFGKNPQKRFNALVSSSIDVVQTVMEDDTAKDATRLKAANMVLDRAVGKPMQPVEVRDSSIKDLYDKLDDLLGGKKKKDVIDSEAQEIEETDYVEIEQKEIEEELIKKVDIEKEKDDVDKWMEENYG